MTDPAGGGWPPVGPSWPGGDAPDEDPPEGPDASSPPGASWPSGGVGRGGPADGDPADVGAADVLAALVEAGATVAVAESLTGGLLCAALTDPAGASAAVRGGLVVYATDLKATLAGVPSPLLAAQGPVSPDVAGALAAGARDRLGATYGLSTTGVAGPDPQGDAAVGTVYIALAGPHGGRVRRFALSGDRAAIRAATVRAALALLAAELGPGAELPG